MEKEHGILGEIFGNDSIFVKILAVINAVVGDLDCWPFHDLFHKLPSEDFILSLFPIVGPIQIPEWDNKSLRLRRRKANAGYLPCLCLNVKGYVRCRM